MNDRRVTIVPPDFKEHRVPTSQERIGLFGMIVAIAIVAALLTR